MRNPASLLSCALLALTATATLAAAAPFSGAGDAATEAPAWTRAQVSIQLGFGPRYRPYYGYGPYYRPYYRPYGYYAPPPVAYYETRPYIVQRARPAGDPDAIARCASRFKSFNANTGTYVTSEGGQRLCPYLR